MRNTPYPIDKIINVANELTSGNTTSASTSEQIAAAFVLNRVEFLPPGYNVIDAWERLGEWQSIVKTINADYSDLLVPW